MKKSALTRFLHLLLAEQDYRKTSYFAEKLMVSNKTISNYITELRYYMRNYDLTIVTKSGVGIRMEGLKADIAALQAHMQLELEESSSNEHRQHNILEKVLMKDECVSVRRLSDEFNISSTSIMKDLEKVEQQLAEYDLSLDRGKQGTSMQGKEQRIRSAKRKFIYDEMMQANQQENLLDLTMCVNVLSRYFNAESLEISKKMIEIAETSLDFHLDTNYYIQIFISYSIFISRIRGHHILSEAPTRPVVTELHILKTYPTTEEMIQWLADQHQIVVDDLDIRWVNARLAGVFHEDQTAKTGYSPIIQETVSELICAIGDIFNADFSSDEALRSGLSKHFVPMFSRLKNNIKITNPFILQIKQQFTAMFSVVSLASSILEKKLGFTLSDDEIGFLLIHFQVALERHNLSKKIAIIYNCGSANALLIENQIKINLPTFDVIELINIRDLKMEYVSHFDFIISTLDLHIVDIPSVIISPIADSSDIQRISMTYEKLIRDVRESRFYYLLQAIKADMILVKQKFKSREEILLKANDILLQKGYIQKEFYESMLNREKISATEIGNGIAIPHGLDKYVNHTSVVLITLQEPILWKESMVSVVFFTAVSFEQKDTMRQLLKDLYHLISSGDLIQQIENAKNTEEVLGLLYGKSL